MELFIYNNIPCPIIEKKDHDSYLILFRGESKWIFECSLGYGEINKDEIGIMYVIGNDGWFHRENGPAVIDHDGAKFWFQYDRYHRLDGPAVEKTSGEKEYWIEDKIYSEEEYWEKIKEINI